MSILEEHKLLQPSGRLLITYFWLEPRLFSGS